MAASSRNREIDVARRYHERTKHTAQRLRQDRHELDWSSMPRPFKVYRDVERIALPADPGLLAGTPPLFRVVGAQAGRSVVAAPGLDVLTRVLYLTAGITKRKRYSGGGERYFRAHSNTGGLYHLDLYLATAALPELPAGVYHFGPEDFSLHRLRDGDHRGVLAQASGRHPRVADAPVVLVCASTYWRNAWKYRARAYRHCFWDGGTLHANLLAVGAAEGLDPEVVIGFADAPVERLLGLDPEREGALTLVALGAGASAPPLPPALPSLGLETVPPSVREVDYPLIRETHRASSLDDGEVAAWRRAARRAAAAEPAAHRPGPGADAVPLPPPQVGLPDVSVADVIRKRGSTRAFLRGAALSQQALSAALHTATRPVAADFLHPPVSTLLEIYLVVHAVDGLAPGTYRYRRDEHALERLRAGDLRSTAGRLALGQPLAADAAVNVYALCDLDPVLERFGNRGYRAAQLEGGIFGGRLYLAAYALGFGATGLTFFDDEVVALFAPAAAGRSVMFLTALGRADRAALGLRGGRW